MALSVYVIFAPGGNNQLARVLAKSLGTALCDGEQHVDPVSMRSVFPDTARTQKRIFFTAAVPFSNCLIF